MTKQTIGAFFRSKAECYGDNPFLVVPADTGRVYHPEGYEISYAQALETVCLWQDAFENAGYGVGTRVAVLLGNRPEMMLLKLALNGLGVSWVPVNPDYRPGEIAYLLQDSAADLAIVAPELDGLMREGIAQAGGDVPCVKMEDVLPDLPKASGAATGGRVP